MGHTVYSLKNLSSILPGDQRPRSTQGEITQELDAMYLEPANLERRRATNLLDLRTGLLPAGEALEVRNPKGTRRRNQDSHRRPGESIRHHIVLPGHVLDV